MDRMLTQSDISQITGVHPNTLAEAAARTFLARLPRMAYWQATSRATSASPATAASAKSSGDGTSKPP